MRAVILTGCLRKNGHTNALLNKFIKGLKDSNCEIDIIDTVKISAGACTGCLSCEKTGNCIINDDMQEVYKKIELSDIVVLASPVYFASVTSQLKAVIDRCQTLYSRRYVLKQNTEVTKKGYLIFTAGLTNTKEIDAMEILAKFFMLSCNSTLEKMIYAMNTDREEIGKAKLDEAYKEGKNATLV